MKAIATFTILLFSIGAFGSKSQFQEHLALVEKPSPVFDEFVAQLHRAGLTAEREPYINTFEATVPRGRSLQKDTPRELRALTFSRGATFIGYAPKTDEGEVISWNSGLGDFEFLQFTGLKKKALKVRVANRNFCLGCHQGASPIFPRAPWSEMTEEASFKKYGVTDVDLAKLSEKDREKKRFFTTAFFDSVVRKARTDLQKSTACRRMCGSDPECRARLFASAIHADDPRRRRIEIELTMDAIQRGRAIPKFARETTAKKRRIESLGAYLSKTWPADGFALPSSALLDRSAAGGLPIKLTGTLRNGEDPNFSEGFAGVAVAASPVRGDPAHDEIRRYFLKEFAEGSEIKAVPLYNSEMSLLDPKSARPNVGAIPKTAAARWANAIALDCFEPNEEMKSLARLEESKLEKALKHPAVVASFCRWPVEESETARLVLGAAEGKLAKVTGDGKVVCSEIASAALPTLAANVLPATLPAGGKFRKYCSECHGKGADIPLALDDLNFLKTYRGVYEPSVKRSLETGAMPPKTSPQPTAEELEAMLNALGT